ncbi:Vitamin B12 transporter BtuB precursor [Vibrio thalassae]|uniref:Vitamin B12 transporter BtuB n=1 Tax=Vibrio thalassae TaxID=1243014 RepID=A0A240ELG4_9VIBR|nr:TonB-dependent receptor [Vibrio thalassae]SNX49093.1 Vitamin B12 transporter BtuB precursor [Vibrio thalassae]
MNKSFLAIAVAASLSSYASFSLAEASQSSAQTRQANETMVVTANRFEQPAGQVLASIDVVTRDDIERTQAKSLTDIVRYLPGVQVSQNGGRGQSTSLFLRGTESAHTLVLLDGVRVNSATAGGFDLSSIPAVIIERVELIRGPRAAVYGADAIGGVLNIITTPEPGESVHKGIAGVGGDGYYQGAWRSVGQIGDNTQGQVTLNKEHSDGYNIRQGTSSDKGETYGYDTQDLVARIDHRFSDSFGANASIVYNQGYSQYDQGSRYRADLDSYQLTTEGYYTSSFWSSKLRFTKYKTDSTNYPESSPASQSSFVTRRNVANWINAVAVSENWTINAGVDLEDENVTGTTVYTKQSRTNNAVFVTSSSRWQAFMLDASARHDDNESYGEHTTWSLALGWQFTQGLRAYVSSGTAFKAPTFNDLYYPNSGNPDLKPQESKSTEIGIDGVHDLISWRLSAYQSEIDNMIIYYPPIWTPENVDATIKGVEFDAQFQTGFISHDVSLGYMDPKDSKGLQLARRAKETASWRGFYITDNWNASLGMLYQGERYSDPSNLDRLPGYVIWDIAANYNLTPNWLLSGRVENLFDKEYETATDYKAQGRVWFLQTSYQF